MKNAWPEQPVEELDLVASGGGAAEPSFSTGC